MAGRDRIPRHLVNEGLGYRDGLPHPLARGHGPLPHHMEEELVALAADARKLNAENRRLIEENMAMDREFASIKDEISKLSHAIPSLRADRDIQERELIQRGLKLEAEVRNFEPLKEELLQLKSEAQKLDSLCQDLSVKSKGMAQDLKHLQTDNQQIATIKGDIDTMRQELVLARTSFEYEKKAHAGLMEQKLAMDNEIISMAREIEKLRMEKVVIMENRARVPGVGAYGALKGTSDVGYFGAFGEGGYSAERGLYSSGVSYDLRGLPRH